jgi:hypothetical protein
LGIGGKSGRMVGLYLFITSANMKLALSAGRPNSAEEPAIQAQLDVFAPMQIEGRSP